MTAIMEARQPLTGRVLRLYGLLALVALALGFEVSGAVDPTLFYLAHEDRWLLSAGLALLIMLALAKRGWPAPLPGDWRGALAIGGGMAVFAFAGHYLALCGYDLSRDENMATFDAAVFARGELVAPLPTFWRDHADALNTLFMYPAEHRGAWISAYLPVNALIRAGVGIVATPALTGPLMLLIGAMALWGCARRIWPADREPATVALLLYLCSGQVLVTGMSSFAMPGHLTLNLVWLWLFLRRRWWADAAALAVGFAAVGLHQPLMHPMFAAPILLLPVVARDWRRALFYLIGYAAIGAFWLWWPLEMWRLVQADPRAAMPAGVDYMTRLTQTVTQQGPAGIVYTMANALRFVAWQPLLLLPLLGLAAPAIRRDRLAAALAGGCVLTAVVMAVALPYQGHGFGYRYIHGLLGNLFLLAAYGWKEIRSGLAQWRGLMIGATVAGLAVILPMQLVMAHALYRPWASVSREIDGFAADYAVIGWSDAPLAFDLVVNAPGLDRRPVRLLRNEISPALAARLCATHPRVMLVGDRLLAPIMRYSGADTRIYSARAGNAKIASVLRPAGCIVMVSG